MAPDLEIFSLAALLFFFTMPLQMDKDYACLGT
jgi:hypothetical protein